LSRFTGTAGSSVECVAGGHVALRGSDESRAKATRALRTADGVAGVRDVQGHLRRSGPA
jgi:osmotically-inducible protein OsmY